MDIESLANLAELIRFIEARTDQDSSCMRLDHLLLEWLDERREPADLAAGIQSGCETGVLECVAIDRTLSIQLLNKHMEQAAARPLLPRFPETAWGERQRRPRVSELAEALHSDRHSA